MDANEFLQKMLEKRGQGSGPAVTPSQAFPSRPVPQPTSQFQRPPVVRQSAATQRPRPQQPPVFSPMQLAPDVASRGIAVYVDEFTGMPYDQALAEVEAARSLNPHSPITRAKEFAFDKVYKASGQMMGGRPPTSLGIPPHMQRKEDREESQEERAEAEAQRRNEAHIWKQQEQHWEQQDRPFKERQQLQSDEGMQFKRNEEMRAQQAEKDRAASTERQDVGMLSNDLSSAMTRLYNAGHLNTLDYMKLTPVQRQMVDEDRQEFQRFNKYQENMSLHGGDEYRKRLEATKQYRTERNALERADKLVELIVPLISRSTVGATGSIQRGINWAGQMVGINPYRAAAEKMLVENGAVKEMITEAQRSAQIAAIIRGDYADIKSSPLFRPEAPMLDVLSAILGYTHALNLKAGASRATGINMADLERADELFAPGNFWAGPADQLTKLKGLRQYIQDNKRFIEGEIRTNGLDPVTGQMTALPQVPYRRGGQYIPAPVMPAQSGEVQPQDKTDAEKRKLLLDQLKK